MTTYTLTVPKVGDWMNANDRLHHMAKANQTRGWREAAQTVALAARLPRIQTPVRIVATVQIADNRRREVSNLFPTFKACIDGFVAAGLFEDDSDAHVVGPDPRRGYDREPRIEFTITEITTEGES